MLRGRKANALAAIAVAILALSTGRGLADDIKTLSGDSQARFIALGAHKSIVLDLTRDVRKILVSDASVANALALSTRRVELIGNGLGQTNVYLYDADDLPIATYNVAVLTSSAPAEWESSVSPANVVLLWGGTQGATFFSCTPIMCVNTDKPGDRLPPGTTTYNLIGGAPGAVSVGGK
jgi:hypothetical protein